jgi:hypothetical protein
MAGGIFISYRRDDGWAEASQICTALGHAGAGDVFLDHRSIQPGDKWPDEIRQALSNASVVLVIVKSWREWLGVDEVGKRRVDQPDDWVRQEVALALNEDKKVIPVLVGNLKMILAEDFPDDLKSLSDIKFQKLREKDDRDGDLQTLVEWVLGERSDRGGMTTEGRLSVADLADRCEQVLRDYNRACVAGWDQVRPSRFVEPFLAIRQDELIQDRSERHEVDGPKTAHQSLLTEEEKLRPGLETSLEQYRRLLTQRASDTRGARVCVTEDAGAGKSIFAQHLHALLASDPGQAVFFFWRPTRIGRALGRA